MHSFDLRETLTPFSVLQVTNHFAAMETGEEMEIIGNDIEIYQDLKIILPASDYELISKEFKTPGKGDFRVTLKKVKITL